MSYFYIESFKFLFIFSFALGVWTSLSLIVKRSSDYYIRGVLIFYIVLLLGAPINTYLNLVFEQPVDFLSVLGHKLSWIYGPLLAVVVNRLLLKEINLGLLLLNFLPFVYFAADQFFSLNGVSFGQYVLLLYVQIIAYLVCALVSVFKRRAQVKNLIKNYKGSSYYWGLHLSIGLIVVMALDLFVVTGLYFGVINSLTFTPILASGISIYICVVALLFLYQPEFSINKAEEAGALNEAVNEAETLPDDAANIRGAELSADAVCELKTRLEHIVAAYQPHRDADISLRKFATLLQITPHQLSELFNLHMTVSFYDYLNNLRHEESIKLLRDTRQNFSVTDIAYRSGYNNRNSFYRVFRGKTGLTPTQYKSDLQLRSMSSV